MGAKGADWEVTVMHLEVHPEKGDPYFNLIFLEIVLGTFFNGSLFRVTYYKKKWTFDLLFLGKLVDKERSGHS